MELETGHNGSCYHPSTQKAEGIKDCYKFIASPSCLVNFRLATATEEQQQKDWPGVNRKTKSEEKGKKGMVEEKRALAILNSDFRSKCLSPVVWR